MNRGRISSRLLQAMTVCVVAGLQVQVASAHGSVTPDADQCIIQIGYFRAHFKVYLPQTHGHKDFCEDLPDTGSSIFVMEYEHDGMATAPIDFRIIRDVTGQGRFANLQHIEQIEDLDSVTVFHHPFAVQPDVFTIAHQFDEPGRFVGIVTIERPDSAGHYTAVFPFEAGFTGIGYWPWVIAGMLLLQVNYFWMSGRFARFRKGRRAPDKSLSGADHA